MYDSASKLLSFISASPKRVKIYLDQVSEGMGPKRLKHFCPTRWTESSDSVTSIVQNFPIIIDTLEVNRSDCDASARSNALSYLASMTKFDLVIVLLIAERTVQYTRPLCESLQSEQCDLVRASEQAIHLVAVIRGAELFKKS